MYSSGEPLSDLTTSKKRAHDRGRSHERKTHHTSGEKQRYYSCDRYCNREQCHTKSATASCATSPTEGQETSNKQVVLVGWCWMGIFGGGEGGFDFLPLMSKRLDSDWVFTFSNSVHEKRIIKLQRNSTVVHRGSIHSSTEERAHEISTPLLSFPSVFQCKCFDFEGLEDNFEFSLLGSNGISSRLSVQLQ